MPERRREFLNQDVDELRDAMSSPCAGADYALVIGVNDYPQLRPLRGAIADAQAFAAWLIDAHGGGLRTENVHSILSTSNPLTPIGQEINDALEDILVRAERSGGRRFYFYFSGHGAVGDRANDLALCLANWSTLRRRAALSSEAWLDVVVRSGVFDEVAFFLDCCRVWATRAVGLPPHIDFAKPVQRQRGTRIFMAYAAEFQRAAIEVDEHSASVSPETRGIFTRALMAGLQGAASADGVVTAASLKKYIEHATEKTAYERGLCQRAEVLNGFEEQSPFSSRRPIVGNGHVNSSRHSEPPRSNDTLARAYQETHARSDQWGRTYERFRQQTQLQIRRRISRDRDTASRMLLVLLARETRPSTPPRSNNAGWFIRQAQKTIHLTGDALQGTWPDTGCVFSEPLKPGAYVLRYNGFSSREMALQVFPGWTTVIVVDDAVMPCFEHARAFLIPYQQDDALPSWRAIFNEELAMTLLNSGATSSTHDVRSDELDVSSNPMLGLLTAHGIARSATSSTNDAHLIDSIASRLESTLGPCPDVYALRLRAALLRGEKPPSVRSTDPPMLREGLLAFIEASHQMPELIPTGSLLEYACIERFVDSPLSSWPFHPKRSDADDWLTTTIEDEATKRGGDMATLDPSTIARELGVPTCSVTTRIEVTRERMTKKRRTSAADMQMDDSSEETIPITRKVPALSNAPKIPGYRLERVIGKGGMGKVYLAQRQTTGDFVAVKVMLPQVAISKEARRQFMREISAMAALRHDRLVTLLDQGEADRCFYFVMPYYERGDLAQWVQRNGAPTVERAVRFILDVCEGLAYAHQSKFVHRDIKPQNLLMDDRGRVVIVDLGLAKCFEEADLWDITKSGAAVGTAAFMPREQAINFKRVRPATDVWSVAAVLYWLLCGVTPRGGTSRGGNSFLSVLNNPIISIRERWPRVPPALGDLIDTALSDDPNRRPADAGAFRVQLENAMDTTLVRAR